MKKILSLILSVFMCGAFLVGCNLFEHDYERDYAREIVSIASVEHKDYTVDKDYRNEYGEIDYVEPVDNAGNLICNKVEYLDNNNNKVELTAANAADRIVKVRETYTYTSEQLKIYKSQLVNYVNYYAGQIMQEDPEKKIDEIIDGLLEVLIRDELIRVEANKLFYAGALYWTTDDVDSIQRSVYAAIDTEILAAKNDILTRMGKDTLSAQTSPEESTQTTYPVMPKEEETPVPVKYPNEEARKGKAADWFDAWYADDAWYVEDQSYKLSYPGLYGTAEEVSLGKEALNAFLTNMFDRSKYIIGITAAQKAQVKEDIKMLKRVRDEQGVSYTYPLLGKTTLFRLLIGNTYINTLKEEKLEAYVTSDVMTVSDSQIIDHYNQRVAAQKTEFTANPTAYDNMFLDENGRVTLYKPVERPIFYTPHNNYIFVKHILLPFSDADTAALAQIKAEEGKNEEEIERRRAKLAENITVYPHVNGENDLANPKTVKQVMSEITATMTRYKNSIKEAERAFDELMYKYSTDTGSVTTEGMYPVKYKLAEDEQDSWQPEFSAGAREFRDSRVGGVRQYKPGELLDHYVVTDFGIHVMYYAYDPAPGAVMSLNEHFTAGAYTKVRDIIEQEVLTKLQSNNYYGIWEAKYLKENKEKHATVQKKLVTEYKKELKKQLDQ